jgi:hypothetical protein
MCAPTIQKIVQIFILQIKQSEIFNVEINACEITKNYSVILLNIILSVKNRAVVWNFITDDKCLYLEINGRIIKKSKFREIIFGNYYVTRYNHSFHQNDNNLRTIIHEFVVSNYLKTTNLVCIGGEMYIYGLILSKFYDIGYFYSDYDSIVDDTCDNLKILKNIKKIIVKKIDYDKDDISKDDTHNYQFVINNGKQGIGINLCNQILRISPKQIIIISCNKKSFTRDYQILKKKYIINQEIDLGIICLYKLSIS